jgi:hypothetical protein
MSYGEASGDGMVHTTLEDLQKWDENFYSARVGGEKFAAEMEDNGKLNDGRTVEYAKGLRVWNYRGLRAAGQEATARTTFASQTSISRSRVSAISRT